MSETEQKQAEYRVLARKYRPQSFAELIGQEPLVRTLSNAIESGRIAHAFMLTGVRGVGKTTTARIIAKALNYKGADGKAGASVGDTSDCALCQAISEDRHPDVIEMDAASRTGIDDIREILDGVRYAPSEARYKVYIIDEVHMLSKQAFNALLKTLEEPPAHVKFIFATTEIRKVPITVLSRCQRFDLRRVDVPTLVAHFARICDEEKVSADDDALQLIARAADGSVRDGLSILDQAMALGGDAVSAQQVQDMLGLADGVKTLDLLEHVLKGAVPDALSVLDDLYSAGSDPVIVLQDLLERVHVLTRVKATGGPDGLDGAMAPDALARAGNLAAQLSMPSLGKAWQILLKGLAEVQSAPNPQNALEMVVMRLSYASDLPDPKDLIKKLQGGGDAVLSNYGQKPVAAETVSQQGGSLMPDAPVGGGSGASAGLAPQAEMSPLAVVEAQPVRSIRTLDDVIAVLEDAGEVMMASEIFHNIELIKMKEAMLEIAVREDAPVVKIKGLQKVLSAATSQNWLVSFVPPVGVPTLAEKKEAHRVALFDNVLKMPMMQDVMRVFPDAKLVDVIEE